MSPAEEKSEKSASVARAHPKPAVTDRRSDEVDRAAPTRYVRENVWLTRSQMRVHPFPKEVAPYMQAYNPLDMEMYVLWRFTPLFCVLTRIFFDESQRPAYNRPLARSQPEPFTKFP